jgi:hypothetical protein
MKAAPANARRCGRISSLERRPIDSERAVKEKAVRRRLIFFGCVLSAVLVSVSVYTAPRVESASDAEFETRCGWFSNPTPANIWLYDRDGEWTIGVQGGYQVEGDWDWPEFKPKQWVETNGHYGYGCVCMQMRVDKETRQVVEIKSSRARPLSVCRKDRALNKWKGSL